MSDGPTERLAAALADRYRLERELGQGGMATVYLAEDLKHHRQVAIKVLRPELAAVLGAERFVQEITTTAQLQHPHILPLFDSGSADGFLYYVMPYVEGETLRSKLDRERQLGIEEAVKITTEVADALDYAHRHGVIHRDIKPDNILLPSGHAVVADFGIAKVISDVAGKALTETGVAIGTPQYMSPEQAAGETGVDGRTDLYALGCVLYEMLTGEPPHTGASIQAVLARKLSEPPTRVSTLRDTVPPAVEAALGKVLARVPADRFSTAAAFKAALTAETPGAPAKGPGPARWRWPAAGVVTVGLVLAGIGVWRSRARQATGNEEDANLIAAMPFRVTTTDSTLREVAAQVPARFWTMVTGQYGPRATDHASVEHAWLARGGTAEAGLPESEERLIAQTQGAALMLRGVVSGSAQSMTIAASLDRVADGRILVPVQTVTGPASQVDRLMDSLVVLVLAREFGATVGEIPRLARHPARAVQAYLTGLRLGRQGPASFDTAGVLLDAALRDDSSFVEAALWKYTFGEVDLDAARYAWDHRDALSPRDGAFLRAEAGLGLDIIRGIDELVAAWDSVTQHWPEVGGPWFELGSNLMSLGPLGIAGWRDRAITALRRAVHITPSLALGWSHLWELAFLTGDSSGIRSNLDSLRATADARWTSVPQQWRVALWFGDTAGAARAFQPSDDRDVQNRPAWAHYVMYALEDGRGMADADRAAAGEAAGRYPLGAQVATMPLDRASLLRVWARARGRHAEWLRWRDGPEAANPGRPWQAARSRLRATLFLGEPSDSAVETSVRLLADVARRDVPAAPFARCWSTLWAVERGARDTTGTHVSEPLCKGLIGVLLAQSGNGDLRSALWHLDSLVRRAPWGYIDAGTINLVLARMLLQAGDTAGALAASRRRRYVLSIHAFDADEADLLPDFLREEGRLAAMTDDRTGAIMAYRHYLALREDPDWEPWRVERDQVRGELAALLRGTRPR